MDEGFTAVKQRFRWGPPDGAADAPNVDLVRTVREAVGDDVDLMADAYMGWNLDYARAWCGCSSRTTCAGSRKR